MRKRLPVLAAFALSSLSWLGCRDLGPVEPVYEVANQCVRVAARGPDGRPRALSASEDGAGYAFDGRRLREATPFFLKPADLGTYLLYDEDRGYLVSEDGASLARRTALRSDVLLLDDGFESPAEWDLLRSPGPQRLRSTDKGLVRSRGEGTLRLRHRRSGRWLATGGLVESPAEAAPLWLLPTKGCAAFPEATLDARGAPKTTRFEDGTLFGIADTHSHILSNFAFGGGGIFHGAPFHRLGVEHALADCERFHGPMGRKDLFGFGFDNPDATDELVLAFVLGELAEDNHATAGWPEFTDWPDAPGSSTHQVQYWRWLERAWLGGLRLVVQHATSNQIICDLNVALGTQEVRYDCNDMVAVDRILEETRAMERYIDAQYGGPGKGFFRIVTSPAEAREVIAAGKMAVILGIETSNLFDCFLVPSEAFPACDEADVIEKLDAYHARGVRAIFPVHKYDNAFSAGDGQKGIIELGNFIQTGHHSNFTDECIDEPSVFDKGAADFPGLVVPRDDFLAPPPFDFSGFVDDPVGTLLPFLGAIFEPPTGQEVCQNAGLTDLGEFLVEQMIARGMILEIDHLPRRSYRRVFEILEQHDYPAAGTHGLNNEGRLYALGGVSKTGFGRCRSASRTATVDDGYQARIAMIEDAGGFPAEGFGFDLNGFAGAPGPRFGPDAGCADPQEDPVTHPFKSYAGDVVFTPPSVGERTLDFNTEGLVHIGLLPELIEDVRGDGVTDAELAPLFRSAEGYLRMWERAEARAAALSR